MKLPSQENECAQDQRVKESNNVKESMASVDPLINVEKLNINESNVNKSNMDSSTNVNKPND